MAGIDYYGIEEKLGEILNACENLNEAVITVEEEPRFNADMQPWCGIFMTSRSPAPNQRIAAGQQTQYHLNLSVWVFASSLESNREAIRLRDDFLSRVEVEIMKNRTIGGMVDYLWLEGGDMMTEKTDKVFSSGAEIKLVCHATSSTV